MVISSKKHNKGKKAEFGGICFDEGDLRVFIGYHTCPTGKKSKILLNLDETRFLANKYGGNKTTNRKKLIKWLANKYEV